MKKIIFFFLASIIFLSFNSSFALSNPASEKCINDGWSLSIVKDIFWWETWICTFPDWLSCEEWSYFNWGCKKYGTINACTMDYNPVCWEVAVQCIKAPCYPIKQTFWNKCELDSNKMATFLYNWECKTDPVACTMEAKLCSDWKTYVGRTWPSCEFEKCPFTKKLLETEKRKLNPTISRIISISKTKWDLNKQAEFLSQIVVKLQEAQVKKPELSLHIDYIISKCNEIISKIYPTK